MIQISQSDFQLALPVGVSAHDEVYESVAPAIATAINNYSTMLLGDAGMRLIESADGSTPVERYFKQLVSIDAFLSLFRQLDLVLTPTGFGIVSNDTLSPASKQRVDALEGQLRTALCRARAMTVDLLRSPEWGVTACAKNFIRYVYTEHYFFFSPLNAGSRSYLDWQAMQTAIADSDEQMRMRFGDEQIDDFIDAYRCADSNRLKCYAEAMQLVCDITDRWATAGRAAASSPLYRRLERTIEADPDIFAPYHSSEACTTAHTPAFANKKDSSAFLFNG